MSETGRGNYSQFFEVNEDYFPCIDDSAIKGGARWDNTYPHKTFVKLLKATELMLGGTTNRSLWIHGGYGTGKSQSAYTLEEILSVPEEELLAYWNSYDALKNEQDLLDKLRGHRERGILTVYRYATGSIHNMQAFFAAVQASVSEAMTKDARITYYGENTLKDTIIAWLEQPEQRAFLDALLKKPEWMATFAEENAEEILATLKKPQANVSDLMNNLFKLAENEGITAMKLDADKLKAWLRDVIQKNNIKIVFFWDEFSDFFKNNRNSLGDFQQVVALCQECPFYVIIVTHQTSEIINEYDEGWKVVQQRFERVEITLPDNIAFELIGHAFKDKPAAQAAWNAVADELNNRLPDSRAAVMKAIKIDQPKIIKDIMPIHPMAALVLKNIASAFASNQRSMFDFIKTQDAQDIKAFQWFISNFGPDDDYPLLTIDMLWDFFYARGGDNLTPDIRMVLDAFAQQTGLRDDEQRVLKTILIMQALDKRYRGEIELLKPTEQNISYAFEGITSGLDSACKNIAKRLERDNVLVKKPLGNNKYAYEVAVLAGDQAKINANKKLIRQNSSTDKLVESGNLACCLSLPPSLKGRFCPDEQQGGLPTATNASFKRVINKLKTGGEAWQEKSVLIFAKDEGEAAELRKKIKESAVDEDYKDILFIDATESQLGEDDFDSYVEFAAMAMYYQGNNNTTARDNDTKAKNVLGITWKNKIYNGPFTVYSYDCQEGERVQGGQQVIDAMKAKVLKRYCYVPDFGKGLTETQFKLTNSKQAALCGANQKTSGIMQGAEKGTLATVWQKDEYWQHPETSAEGISEIKRKLNNQIDEFFNTTGQVAICDVLEFLEASYGYRPSNLMAFMTGFLLKEYGIPPYRYTDQNGTREEMSPDKLSEMIDGGLKHGTQTYIVKMTPEEKAFYETTEKAWGIAPNTLSSPARASSCVKTAMQRLGLPVWSLQYVDENGVYNQVGQYIAFVQKQGPEEQQAVTDIGKAAKNDTNLGETLHELLTEENCKQGMRSFLKHFEDGRLLELAENIGASDRLLEDVKKLFSLVEYSSLWNEETGKEQIKKLVVDYTFVQETNAIIDAAAHSKHEAKGVWREKLKYVLCSCERLQETYPEWKKLLATLKNMALEQNLLPEQLQDFVSELSSHAAELKQYFSEEVQAFSKIYADYLENLSDDDIEQMRPELFNIFVKSRTDSNSTVRAAADKVRQNQIRTQLFQLWKSKTGSKNPRVWSTQHKTPILSIVSDEEYSAAKRAFETLNRPYSTENEMKSALDFLETSSSIERLQDEDAIRQGFLKLLGSYYIILSDLERVRDELDELAIDAYDWDQDPRIKAKIRKMAKVEYDAGGSDKVVAKIESMNNEDLKRYLVEQVRNNIGLGMEILNGGK